MTDRPRATKLVCTIGPASVDRVDELVEAGMDVARINFSHGTPERHAQTARRVRQVASNAGRRVALMTDLAGPKIRLGDVPGGRLELAAGERIVLGAGGTPVSYAALARDVRPGDRVLLADGAAELRVVEAGDAVVAEVIRGGEIRSRAGVNVPAERLSTPSLTERDRADVPRALELGVDYVAQSFVRRASDVEELRSLLGRDGPRIVAKIETRPAVDDYDAICEAADAVMIARGDLGVELPYERVPILQKQLLRHALDRGVPAIVATQMLESMVSAPRPTRAEASDVANAIFDGADAIMLSGETAIGQFPVLAAQAAVRVAELCETDGRAYLPSGAPAAARTDADALAVAAVALAHADADVAAIACYTRSGRTARLLAALRPHVPILAFSPDPRVVDQLALVRGVEPRACVPPEASDGRLSLMAWLVGESALPDDSAVVLVASTAEPGTGPNLLEVHRVRR
ncbi:MAG TPA: pyruvate kinase [Candidatus Limnocylindria bacterium]|jgi:pyruvate kinase|nr:pyruvate kinase [Candidatus Limnocylindria bacterium]